MSAMVVSNFPGNVLNNTHVFIINPSQDPVCLCTISNLLWQVIINTWFYPASLILNPYTYGCNCIQPSLAIVQDIYYKLSVGKSLVESILHTGYDPPPPHQKNYFSFMKS